MRAAFSLLNGSQAEFDANRSRNETNDRDCEWQHYRPRTKGDKFRDKVADLLRISGLDPKVELLIGSKKVDIYFEDRHLGRKRRFTVEAKNYSRPLLAKDLENIIGS